MHAWNVKLYGSEDVTPETDFEMGFDVAGIMSW